MKRLVTIGLISSLFVVGGGARSAHAANFCAGSIVVDATQHITNDPDSGMFGNWALDNFDRHIQIFNDNGQYCAETNDSGTFTTFGGVSGISPESGSALPSVITGTIVGSTHGLLTGDPSDIGGWGNTPPSVDCAVTPEICSAGLTSYWVQNYFSGGTYGYGNNWGWTYTSLHNGTWVNAAAGNSGDITPAPFLTFTVPAFASVPVRALLQSNTGVAVDGAEVDVATASLSPITVNLTNTGDATTGFVRINPINVGAHIQVWAKSPLDNIWYDVNAIGWGEIAGLQLPPGFDNSVDSFVISDVAGDYQLPINLVLANDPTSILASATTTVHVLAPQTITFNALDPKVYGDADFTLSATSTSGLAISYSSSGACSVTGDLVHLTGAGSCDITASQVGGSGYSAAIPVAQSFVVNPKPITISAVADNKPYDGTASAGIHLTVNGKVGTDDVSANGTGAFSDKNAGTSKTVNVTGVTLSGSAAGNYSLAVDNTTATANITRASLNVIATGVNKVYDGTNVASVNLADNHIGSDVITTGYTSAIFADANVGNGKSVSVTGISITGGADVGNYSANSTASASADVTIKALSVTANNDSKTYNGVAYSGGNGVVYSGFVPLENQSVLGGTLAFGGTAQGATNAGTYTIAPSGLTSNNYDISFNSGTLTVNKANAAVSVQGATLVYDGNTHGATGSATGAAGENLNSLLNLGSSFRNIPGGTANWTFAGDANHNSASGSVSITISARPITVTGVTSTKIYDGTLTAGATPSVSGGIGAGDTANFTEAFVDKNVGASKILGPSGSVNDGNSGHNYSVSLVNGHGSVTAKSLTANVTASNKQYDGTNSATVTSRSLNGVINGETILANGGTAAFADANAASGKTVNVSGMTLSGTGSGNYSFNGAASTQANITAAPVTVTANNKVKAFGSADPALTYSGALLGSDAFSGALARVSGESVGTYAINQGTLSAGSNYNLTFVPGMLTISDQSAPVITLNGDSQVSVGYLFQFTDPGATALDDVDGSVAVSTGGDVVDVRSPGTYTLTYNAVDSNGNHAAQVTRTVVVGNAPLVGSRSSGGGGGGGAAVAQANANAGEVLGAFVGPEGTNVGVDTPAVAAIKVQLVSLIRQLIAMLQSQLAAAIAAGGY